jgi:hypothetical protein
MTRWQQHPGPNLAFGPPFIYTIYMNDLYELDRTMPEVDLHHAGSISAALELLDRELSRLLVNEDTVRIIYGIGEGKLSEAVRKRLQTFNFIKTVHQESSGGSCIVFFK